MRQKLPGGGDGQGPGPLITTGRGGDTGASAQGRVGQGGQDDDLRPIAEVLGDKAGGDGDHAGLSPRRAGSVAERGRRARPGAAPTPRRPARPRPKMWNASSAVTGSCERRGRMGDWGGCSGEVGLLRGGNVPSRVMLLGGDTGDGLWLGACADAGPACVAARGGVRMMREAGIRGRGSGVRD